MERITKEQINKLLSLVENYNLLIEWVYGICNVDCITDITVLQYNYLLMIIKTVTKGF